MGAQAWVTSAVEDKDVEKVIALAGSFRRVFTSKLIAVLTTENVSKDLRKKLKHDFDHVQLVEQWTPGFKMEDYVKVHALGLKLFTKCVYLAPESIILRNCDDVFDKYETYAACRDVLGQFDPSVFLYTPSLEIAEILEDCTKDDKETFSQWFELCLRNKAQNISVLEDKYNFKVNLERPGKSLNIEASIAVFTGQYPLSVEEILLKDFFGEAGPLEKHAVATCLHEHSKVKESKINRSLSGMSGEPVAIVGLSFRLPGGNNEEEFWNLLENGKEGIKPLPPFRWTKEHSLSKCYDRSIEAGFLDFPVDEFDSKFFGFSPKEAEFLDPQQRLLHQVAWEALEDAMIDPHSLYGSNTGFFVGSWVFDYHDFTHLGPEPNKFRSYMGTSLATEASRLSHFFQTTGPSIATESGCSSSIVAVHLACKSLQKHETNLSIACGVNLLLHPIDFGSMGFVLSKDGRCKTFDSSADGFGRAEACNVLILKRLSDAVKDGDNIWGLIRGSAVTQEGVSKSLGTPTIHCESLAMKLALEDSGVRPQEVEYIETHGTGTAVGDPLEVAAIAKAYSTPERAAPVLIGSVKTNVGHTESASGITGIIKVLLSMKNEKIPPHRNLTILNPAIKLDGIPAEIPLELRPWPKRNDAVRVAGVSSFGISGTDGHAIIQEPPSVPNQQIHYGMDRSKHILKLSAKSPQSMEEILQKYEQLCTEKSSLEEDDKHFANLAYSANTGRASFNHRAVIIAKDSAEAAKILKEKSFEQKKLQGKGSKLCFLFTGQGSQYLNMASNLYQTSPVFRHHFDKCDEVLNKYGIYIRDVIWGKDEGELSRTLYSQTSIFVVEYCLLKLWESWGVTADYVMGHSLGEFAAACAAGVLDFEDALKLVAERSRLVDALPRGKMLVIKADKQTVDKHIAKLQQNNSTFWLDYAAINAADQTVLAGDSESIEKFAQYCKNVSIKCIVLAASHAFHSRHMDPMLAEYKNIASTVKKPPLNKSLPKFISGVDGKLIPGESIDAKYWVRHTREKVSFIEACKAAQEDGCSLFLEVGPHPVLSALVMANIEGQSLTCLPSLRRGKEEWSVLLESLGKLYLSDWKGEVDWKGFDRHYKRSRLSLPFYPFNKKPTWLKTRYRPDILHPLLGKPLPNASGRTLFEAELTLKIIPFVKDHVIGKTVIFPGAAFLEMCLAGGYSAAQSLQDDFTLPRKPIVLSGLQIQTPLALHDHTLCVLQTTVHLDEDEENTLGYFVKIYKEDEDTGSGSHWVPHASGKFLPVAPTLPSHLTESIDIQSVLSSWSRSDNKDFYKKLPEVGLRFGPSFQTLESKWTAPQEEAVLMSVKLPEDASNYLIHPVVSDAMIQTVMLWTSKGNLRKLHVPVSVGEFIWLGQSDSKERFIYCANTSSGTGYALLVDGTGLPLAYMEGVEFAETNVKLVESIIQQQQTPMPNLWEEIYKPVPGPTQGRLTFKPEVAPNLTPEEIKEITLLNSKAEENFGSQKSNAWIIFANEIEQFTLAIQNHLEGLNRKVIVVPKLSKSLSEQESEVFVENALRATDQLFLEGIFYCWGLSTSNERDQSLVGLPFLSLCKKIVKSELNFPLKIFVLTQGQLSIEDSDVLNPVPATATGIAKTVFNEHSINIQHIDLCPLQAPTSQIEEILANFWTTSFEPIVAFRQGKRFCQKISSCKLQNDSLSIPNGCDRFQLILPKTRVINDLEFDYLEHSELSETEVEVKVKATALNFRDVFTVLKPIKDFEDFNAVGLDFAGVIVRLGSNVTKWKVGDRVMGMNMNRNLSLPSHIKMEEALLVSLPEEITFSEGATLPAVFSTVIHCLVDIAKMQKGETLLLHTASGGVGLCAIQLAKHFEVIVIATAGNNRKRNYLRNLGVKHVFNSRTTDFGKQVLEVTNGKGVEIVLNTLTGEGFKETSLSALGKKGRFVEVSKLNIWTAEEVKILRPDVLYEVVDLTKLEKHQYEALTVSMRDYLHERQVRPIPYEIFDALNIRQALYYLQKAKHIGKIVCLMPEIKIENSRFVYETMLFNGESTYIITGGLGGIGLEVAKFMLTKGAKHVALVSRSKPNPEIERLVKTWNTTGKHVEAFSVDIGNYEKCRNFIEYLKSPESGFPPIRGVMHAAGVLSDSILLNQTWDKFKSTFNPKLNGTWNLHDLTKDLLLEHFVLFSSIAAVLGVPGQANHVASNSFQDAFAHFRKSQGLPATSIKWGNWGEVGIATEVDFPGVRPISTKQGILVLETMLKTQRTSVAVLNVESFSLVVKLFPLMKLQIADKRLLGDTQTTVHVNTDEFWQRVDGSQDKNEKINVFKTSIKTTIKNILKLDSSEDVDANADFQTLGIDSLMMLEMKNSLQNIFTSRLTITTEQLKDCSNIEMLANKFVNVLEGIDVTDFKLPTIAELRELIKEDSILAIHISPQSDMIPVKPLSEIQTVLLTGVTGVLGPYVLRELTNRPKITKIFCLIRKVGKLGAIERLQKRLEIIGIADQIDLNKVECISGDVVHERFGLSSKEYEHLAENTDCVVHCAVRADHTEKYWKAPDQKKNNVRAVNVKGTERVLEFAACKRLKHFYYASTLLAVPTTNKKGSMSEDWQDLKAFDNILFNWGYPISKFISEQHIKQAIERGVPCKVFRFGMIGGDSKTGRHDYLNAHFVLRWLAFMKLRCMPDFPMPLHIFPVDYCAKVSLEVFFNPEAPNEPFNVMHPYGGGDQTLIKIAEEMGIEIKHVSFSEFAELLKEEGDDSPLAQFKQSYEEEEECNVASFGGNPLKSLRHYIKNSNNFFRSSKMPRYIPNYNEYDSTETTMRRDIKFLKDSGVFEKFGIK